MAGYQYDQYRGRSRKSCGRSRSCGRSGRNCGTCRRSCGRSRRICGRSRSCGRSCRRSRRSRGRSRRSRGRSRRSCGKSGRSCGRCRSTYLGNDTYKPINPIVSNVGNFKPFYIAIAICSLLLGFLIILNIICCCSKYSNYWRNRHTGNRWIVSIWSTTPHNQPSLDYSELQYHIKKTYLAPPLTEVGHDVYGCEVDFGPAISQQVLTSSQEYLELHKRESDI